jgi:hypothetical protein
LHAQPFFQGGREVSSEKARPAGQDKRESGDYQRAVGELVQREVLYCVSGLVFEIGREKSDEWFHLFVQEDWQTPVREAIPDLPREKLLEFLGENEGAMSADSTTAALSSACLRHLESEGSWQDFCHANDLEPQRNEIYEHWIVSDWLARRLEERGEVIERDFYGLTVWGRACTGQAILLDGVICSIYDELHKDDQRQKIAELNDRFRAEFFVPAFGPRPVPGHIFCTPGIAALPPETQINIWGEVANFNTFAEDNAPRGERDFGAFTMPGVAEKIFWKIDYYADKSCTAGAEDPADPAQSFRVLTIMFSREY